MIKRTTLILGMVSVLNACSWFGWGDKDTTEPPAELTSFDETLSVDRLWSAGIGGTDEFYLKLRPVVDGNHVFAANYKGDVYAFDAVSGDRIWDVDLDKRISGGVGAAEDIVLVGTTDAEVIALEQQTGAVRWLAQVSSEVLSAPAVENGVVVVRSGDGKLTGLNAETGKRLWIYDLSIPVLSLRGTSSPVISRGVVLAGFANGKLVALNLKDGKQIWETTVAAPRGRSELERMVDIDSEPVVMGNIIYVVTYQGYMSVIDMLNGQILWTRKMSSSAGMTTDRSNMYVADSDGHVWAFTNDSGRGLWKQEKLHARALSAPAVQGDYVVVGDLEGYVHWMSRETGAFAAREHLDSSPIIASPVVANNILYVISQDGDLAAYALKQ